MDNLKPIPFIPMKAVSPVKTAEDKLKEILRKDAKRGHIARLGAPVL